MIRRYVVLLALVLTCAFAASAQNVSPAVKAYRTWEAKISATEVAQTFIVSAFSASKSDDDTAVIDFAIGTGEKVGDLGKVTFVVQPMSQKQDEHGKQIFEPVGDPSTLLAHGSEKSEGESIAASARITIRIPTGATVVQVKVIHGETRSSATLPLLAEPSTAIVAGFDATTEKPH
jgi:hypothetical protein